MRRSSKILKCGSSKVWVTVQMPSSVSSVPLCETIKDNDLTAVASPLLKGGGPGGDGGLFTASYSYDPLGRISSITNQLLTPHSSLLTSNYTWNGENRLIVAETRNDLPPEVPRYRIDYAYDHQGRMISKEVSDISNNCKLTTKNFLSPVFTHMFIITEQGGRLKGFGGEYGENNWSARSKDICIPICMSCETFSECLRKKLENRNPRYNLFTNNCQTTVDRAIRNCLE